MRIRTLSVLITVAVAASGAWVIARPPALAQEPKQLTAEELQRDILLLEVLARAQFTDDELRSLADAASKVGAKREALLTAREDPARIAALEQLREGLLQSLPDEQLGPLHEQVEPLNETIWRAEEAMHEAMQEAVTGLLGVLPEATLEALLKARMGDPTMWLVELCHESRHIPPAEYEEWLGDVSRDIAAELAGDEGEPDAALVTKVAALLGSTRNMTNEQLDAADDQILAQATALAASARPAPTTEQLADRTRDLLFGLLENPRLDAVLKAKLQRG